MIPKAFIKKLSKALDKPQENIDMYFKEFLSEKSLLSQKEIVEFFVICVENSQPSKRYLAVSNYLLELLKKRNLVDCAVGLINIDPCFNSLSMFNIQDYIKKFGVMYKEYFLIMPDEEIEYGEDYFDMYGFLPPVSSYMSYDMISNDMFSEDVKFYSSAERMSYRFVDKIIYQRFKLSKRDSVDFFYELYKHVGLKIIEIDYFRFVVKESTIFSELKSSEFKDFYYTYSKIKQIFSGPFPLKRKELTLKRNWLYYLIIEELKNMGYETAETTKKLNDVTGEDRKTLRRNYFRMKKEAQKKDLDKEIILLQNELSIAFGDYMRKITNDSD